MKNLLTISLVTLLIFSCGKEGKKRGLDYDKLKQELTLNAEQEQKFDEVATKFKKLSEENRAANTSEGGKMNRVALFTKMEELNSQQKEEMKTFLDETQFERYVQFMQKNTRKRPRYDDELLTKIKTELQLDDEQSKVLEAANNAFEQEFHDAHDIYHGNSELAKEYWGKFDTQRKTAIESILNEEQQAKFNELVKDQEFKGRE